MLGLFFDISDNLIYAYIIPLAMLIFFLSQEENTG